MTRRGWISSIVLLVIVLGTGGMLAAWKVAAVQKAAAASVNQHEPMESITAAVARNHEYRPVTTSIGTVLALQSISLRNEMPGTVDTIMLTPGKIVEAGTLLVALDVSVEQAELQAHEARAALAKTTLDRVHRANQQQAVSEIEVEEARAEYDVARAEIARIKAIIARKTILAPFRARVGISDVHPGQYLETGTLLTTLQGVEDAVHVDFTVAQHVAAGLREGEPVEVLTSSGADSLRPLGEGQGASSAPSSGESDDHHATPIEAQIIAIDSRVDPATRNAMVRAKINAGSELRGVEVPAPGSSVRVRIPSGPLRSGVLVPASAVRKGPGGDRVFVILPDDQGDHRAHSRLVKSGAVFGDEVVIDFGLDAGELVAASGSFKLRDGALVAIANETEALALAGAPGAGSAHNSLAAGRLGLD